MRIIETHTKSRTSYLNLDEYPGESSVMRKIALLLSLIVIFKIPSESVFYTYLGSTVSMGLGLVAMVFWVATVIFTGKFRKLTLLHSMIFIFFFWNVLSFFWSVDIDRTIDRLLTYFQMIIMFMMLWDLYSTPRALKAGLQAYVLGAFVAIGSLIANYLSGIQSAYLRYSAVDINADDLALILVLGIPIAWNLANVETSSKVIRGLRLINYAYIPAAIVSILISATRGASVAALPAFLYMLISMPRIKLTRGIVIFLAMTGALVVLVPLAPQTSVQRVIGTPSAILAGDLTGRYEIWRESLDVFVIHPLLGVGSGAVHSALKSGLGSHNVFLSVLVQVGIIGLILYVLILAISFHYAMRHTKWERIFWLTLLIVWTVGNLTLSFEHRKTTWLILALVAASASLYVRQDKSISNF